MTKRAAGEAHVAKRADGRWHARRSIGPRGAAKVFHGYGATRDAAIADMRRKIREAARTADINAAARWRMDQFLVWWVNEELAARVDDGTIADTTVKSYAQAVRLHLSPRLKDVRLVDLRAVHVRRLLDQTRAAGLSDRHRRYLQSVLSAALSCAARYELIEVVNPASLVQAPKVAKQRRPGVPVEDAAAFLRAATGDRLEAYWRVMLSAPLRPGEPKAMVWDDVDFDAGTYHVRRNLVRIAGRWVFHDCKGHEDRVIPLGPATVAALRRRKAEQAAERLAAGVGWKGASVVDVDGQTVRPLLVFTYEDGSPLHQTWIGREVERVCARAGIPRWTPHRLRHAANTLLRQMGVADHVIQQLAGHASASMTDLYTGTVPAAMRAAVDGLESVLSQASGHAGSGRV